MTANTNDGEEEEKNTTFTMRPRTARQQCCTHHRTSPTHTTPRHHTNERENGTMREGGGRRQYKGDRTTRGDNTTTHTPPFNGTTTQTEGGHHAQDGEASNTAALHSPCHPPPTMPPTTHNDPTLHHDEGERTEDTPPHKRHKHTLTTHTPHLAGNSARHDSSTRQHCNGMSRARDAPLHWAGQQQHTPPPFHTPRRMDTIHSSTHLLSLIHVHTTDDQR